jgi:hypothetical protein
MEWRFKIYGSAQLKSKKPQRLKNDLRSMWDLPRFALWSLSRPAWWRRRIFVCGGHHMGSPDENPVSFKRLAHTDRARNGSRAIPVHEKSVGRGSPALFKLWHAPQGGE